MIRRLSLLAVLAFALPLSAAEWTCPKVPTLDALSYPRIAATPDELSRLKAAYNGEDAALRQPVERVVHAADAALNRTVVYPPRGGQHNQWYQCDKCQLALKTVDATHHQCPKCKKVYTGEPYDDVLYSKQHYRNVHDCNATAWAYAITGEEKYARRAADILLGYADRYRKYPYHASSKIGTWARRSGGHIEEQTLDEAGMMSRSIAPAYDLLKAGDFLTSEEDRAVREGLLVPMLENIEKNRAGKSNWQTWHNAAILAGGAVLGDESRVERALTAPGNGFAEQMRISVTEDGMWYENSWGYHFYTLSAMIKIAESARRIGVDVWSHPRFKRMFTIAPAYAMPGGRLPRLGDDVNSSLGSAAGRLEFAYHAYRDPQMEPYLSKKPTWDSIMLGRATGNTGPVPKQKSRDFPAAGHVILRSGGKKEITSLLTYGPYGGFHGHLDKLSFVLYAHGKELGVDPGRARSQAYRLPIHRNWYKATLSHNTVTVDGKSQKGASGELLEFEVRPEKITVVAKCDKAYPGVTHVRRLEQTPNELRIVDELTSDEEHRYDWFYHNRGKVTDHGPATQSVPEWKPDAAGMEFVQDVRIGKTDAPGTVEFTTDGIRVRLEMDAAPGTKWLTGTGPAGSILDRAPFVRVTRKRKCVRFEAVLTPKRAEP